MAEPIDSAFLFSISPTVDFLGLLNPIRPMSQELSSHRAQRGGSPELDKALFSRRLAHNVYYEKRLCVWVNIESRRCHMRLAFFVVLCFSLLCPAAVFCQTVQPAPSGRVVFYQDYQCTTGNCITLRAGEHSDLRQWNTGAQGSPNWNDQISCMVMGSGISKVIVYEHINFKGKSKTFTRTSNNPLGCWSLAGNWWNDKISSIKIR